MKVIKKLLAFHMREILVKQRMYRDESVIACAIGDASKSNGYL